MRGPAARLWSQSARGSRLLPGRADTRANECFERSIRCRAATVAARTRAGPAVRGAVAGSLIGRAGHWFERDCWGQRGGMWWRTSPPVRRASLVGRASHRRSFSHPRLISRRGHPWPSGVPTQRRGIVRLRARLHIFAYIAATRRLPHPEPPASPSPGEGRRVMSRGLKMRGGRWVSILILLFVILALFCNIASDLPNLSQGGGGRFTRSHGGAQGSCGRTGVVGRIAEGGGR